MIHTEEKPYDKSVHTGEEPYIYDYTIVSLINNLVHKNNPLSYLLVKINHFGHREPLAPTGIAYLMFKSSLIILFCKADADFDQIATFFLELAVYSRHTVAFLDLTYSCRTLFYDNFDKTLLHFILFKAPKCGYSRSVGMLRKYLGFLFLHFYCYDIMFFKQYYAGLEEVIILSWPHSAMTLSHNPRQF